RVLPVIVSGETVLVNPQGEELCKAFGLQATGREGKLCDCIIVGGGPTGLAAAIYTTREQFKTVVLEKMVVGGQILTTAQVENYPGFPEPISGAELTDRLATQAKRFGTDIRERAEVTRIESQGDLFVVHLDEGDPVVGRTVILAPGSQYRHLGVPGEKEFTGYGVSYCGTCDAPFYRDKHVVAVGGGNTAVDEGLHLLKFVKRLTIVQNRNRLTATPFLIEELGKHKDRAEVLTSTAVVRIEGKPEERVTGVVLKDLATGQERPFACDGVFVWIGMTPNTGFLKGTVDLDDGGFVRASNASMETAVAGLFAAGDCRSGSQKQIATATGEGVAAALFAAEYIRKQKTAVSATP
ncbi:MAG: FAD-dependent oxidoreductase, partial [Planctomycetes bacterium]|nr:FAD-dependent oxidoreductase [Planctomycetota bacterium]